jgi:hypothetical protein
MKVRCLFLSVCALFFLTICGHAADTGEMRLEAVLVWGTNGQKPSDSNLKPLEEPLVRKLNKTPYKWKTYYEVERKNVSIPLKSVKQVPMSKHCSLEITYLGDTRIEVKLVGKGKLVSRNVEPLPVGQTMIISGDDKNDTAWLILLRQIAK